MKAILCLGRAGDIINSLPMAYKLYRDTGHVVGFIISSEYVDMLDGVSYVVPYVYYEHFTRLGQAYTKFKNTFEHIHVAQVYKSPWKHKHESFCQDMWDQAELWEYFDKVPLVFDNRDSVREKALVQQYIHGTTILVNFTGHSAPLRASYEILMMLQRSWGLMANIVNIGQVQCHRLYDLLGLYDAAQLLITSDTATLHLAAASKIPSIQLLPNHGWNASIPRGNCILSVQYDDLFGRLTEVHSAIANTIS